MISARPLFERPQQAQERSDAPGTALSALDWALANLFCTRIQPAPPPKDLESLRLAAAICHRNSRQGHTALNLHEIPSVHPNEPLSDWPSPAEWDRLLQYLGTPPPDSLFHWTHDACLQLSRFHQAESSLASRIETLAHTPADSPDEASPNESILDGCAPEQQEAILACRNHHCLLLSGGPGTGKTFTVLRCIAAILQSRPEAQLALCAPTGKAVARLMESINRGLEHLPIDPQLKSRIPREASTLHRILLKLEPKNHASLLPHTAPTLDWIFIDEASMVDLSLMSRLLRRLPHSCRIFLLGDTHQLASVEPGSVFTDWFEAAKNLGPQSGMRAISLRQTFRFEGDSPIQNLCEAIRQGSFENTQNQLRDPKNKTSLRCFAPDNPQASQALEQWVDEHLLPAAIEPEPAKALKGFRRFMVLCATHRGPQGVHNLNRSIRKRIEQACREQGQTAYWVPLLVTRNHYESGLFNGDLGLRRHALTPSLSDDENAWFEHADGTCNPHPLNALPENEEAFAITIHKSQGSEAPRVAVLLPSEISPILTRELLYTAASRTRSELLLIAHPERIRNCIERPTQRLGRLKKLLPQDTQGKVCCMDSQNLPDSA
jgi:exodeoxyribonuclease V alpha subunit